MPRKNNSIRQKVREPSRYDFGFLPKCRGCAFAGTQFKCMAADARCLQNSRSVRTGKKPER